MEGLDPDVVDGRVERRLEGTVMLLLDIGRCCWILDIVVDCSDSIVPIAVVVNCSDSIVPIAVVGSCCWKGCCCWKGR